MVDCCYIYSSCSSSTVSRRLLFFLSYLTPTFWQRMLLRRRRWSSSSLFILDIFLTCEGEEKIEREAPLAYIDSSGIVEFYTFSFFSIWRFYGSTFPTARPLPPHFSLSLFHFYRSGRCADGRQWRGILFRSYRTARDHHFIFFLTFVWVFGPHTFPRKS